MFRTVLRLVGVVEVLAPGTLVDVAERIALENPDECETRGWVVSAARTEGVALLLVARRGGGSLSVLKRLLAVVGVLAFVAPKRFVDYSARIGYTDAGNCRWKSWVYPLTRAFGLVYVLVAVDDRRRRRSAGG